MKRRRFLQLAASIGAGAVVQRSFALSAPSLRLAQFSGIGLHGTVIALVGNPVLTRSAVAALSSAAREPIEACTEAEGGGRSPDTLIEMLWEKGLDTQRERYQWVINGQIYAENKPLGLLPGQRYRLRMMNGTGQSLPLLLQDHSFQVRQVCQTAISGRSQSAIRLDRYSVVDADIVVRHASNAGSVL